MLPPRKVYAIFMEFDFSSLSSHLQDEIFDKNTKLSLGISKAIFQD
jgi:hypothetical protein